jgi:hypothetical protein
MTKRARARLAGILLAFLLITSVAQAAAPDFSGTWVLNLQRSDFGPLPGPAKESQAVDHKGPTLKVKAETEGEQGPMSFELQYTTDGAECKNTIMGMPLVSKVKPEGESLKFDAKLEVQGMQITIQETWTLAEEGKVLKVKRLMSSEMGEAEQNVIYDKK